MATFKLNNNHIRLLSINHPNMNNKDFYIRYLYDLCENEIEKAVIYRVMKKALQNNSVIRMRNYFIKEGMATKTDLEHCRIKQEEIRQQFRKTGLFDAIRRWFNRI